MSDDQKQDEKLYAGKFKTVEDLEVGYKNSAAVYEENEKLKSKLDEFTKVPDNYMNPSDVQHEENRIKDIQARAKEAGMTQAQYEKFLRNDKTRFDQSKQNFENAKKDVGQETLNLLNDYVGKHYPKELQEGVLRTLIQNKDARQSALNHRQQLLSNKVPGVGSYAPQSNFTVTQEDVNKAYKAKEANKGDLKARQHYLNLIAAQAEQKAG